jgi:hypothetical protein
MQGGERSTTNERCLKPPKLLKPPDGFNFHSKLGINSTKIDTLKPPTYQTSMKV